MVGAQHKFKFIYCDCEPLAVLLVRAKLWPATPHHPRFAFTFGLLDWAEALMLECQVSLKDFNNALKFRNPFCALKVSYLFLCHMISFTVVMQERAFYNSFLDSFEEYRLVVSYGGRSLFCVLMNV